MNVRPVSTNCPSGAVHPTAYDHIAIYYGYYDNTCTHSPQVVQHSPAGMSATEQLTLGHVSFCICTTLLY